MKARCYSGLAALLTDNFGGAADAFHEQLELARELVILPAAFEGLRGLAAVAAHHGDHDRAARLCDQAGKRGNLILGSHAASLANPGPAAKPGGGGSSVPMIISG